MPFKPFPILMVFVGLIAACQPLRPPSFSPEPAAIDAAAVTIQVALPASTQALVSNTQSVKVLLTKTGLADQTSTVNTGTSTTVTFKGLPPGGGYTLYAAGYSGTNASGTMMSWGKLPVTLASGTNAIGLSLSVAIKSGNGADSILSGPAGSGAQLLGAQKVFTSYQDLSAGSANGVEVFVPGQYQYLGQFGSLGGGNGQFNHPDGSAVDSLGNLYVVDRMNHRVQKFDKNYTFVRGWGQGMIWTAAPPATASGVLNGHFDGPTGIAIDPAGHLWVADTGNHRLQKFDTNGNFLMGLGKGADGNGSVWVAGTAAPAVGAAWTNGSFNKPHSLAFDKEGNLWVGDSLNHRLQKFNASGRFLRAIGNGIAWDAGTLAVAPATGSGPLHFSTVYAPTLDAEGTLHVVDNGNQRVQRIAPPGVFLGEWSTSGAPYPAAITPWGVLLAGAPYTGSSLNVGVFTRTGTRLSQFGSFGALDGQFSNIRPMSFTQDGTIVIADYTNHRVQRFKGVVPSDPTGGVRLSGHRQPDTPTFAATGSFETPPVDAGSSITWGTASWTVSLLPPGAGVSADVATSLDGYLWSTFTALAPGSVAGSNVAALTGVTGRFLKLRLNLSTGNPASSPEVQDVKVSY